MKIAKRIIKTTLMRYRLQALKAISLDTIKTPLKQNGDVSLASFDSDYELIGIYNRKTKDKYTLSSNNLNEHIIPKNNRNKILIFAMLFLAIFIFPQNVSAYDSPAPVDIGTASDFVVLTKAGIANTGVSNFSGNIGAIPITAASMTVLCAQITNGGRMYGIDVTGPIGCSTNASTLAADIAKLTLARDDMDAARADIATRTPDETAAAIGIGGRTFTAGVYKFTGAVTMASDLTISGNDTDIFIFYIVGAYAQTTGHMNLVGGAQAKNVFWRIDGAVSMAAPAKFTGILMSGAANALAGGASIDGRVFAQTSISTISNTISIPLSNDNSLPVTLSEFKLDLVGGSVHLSWRTSAEIDNLGFNIQRQEADRNWLEIDSFTGDKSLAGHGSTTEEHRYTYTDSRVTPGTTFRYRLQDVDYAGKVTTHDDLIRTITTPDFKATPESFDLVGAYPNPFNPTTTISYSIPEQSIVTLTVLDIKGQELVTLQNDLQTAGNYKLQWNGKDQLGNPISAGVYFCRLHAGSSSQTIKMVYVK